MNLRILAAVLTLAFALSSLVERTSARSVAFDGHYTVVDLGTLGGNASSASSINEIAWVTGAANLLGDHYARATLWRRNEKLILGTLGGPNSGVFWPNHNNSGLIAGISETAQLDPLGEDWSCHAFFPTNPDTKHVCRGFMWRDHVMKALPTLGGINGFASGTNDEGSIVGWAETSVHDRTCTAVTKTPNSFYQVLQFAPAVWDTRGRIERLPTLPGDPDGSATAINDRGEIVGISGICDQAVGRFSAAHAVIWRGERVAKLPTFGGVSWNTPQSINNRGEVAGFLNLPGDTKGQFQPIGFVWSPGRGLRRVEPLSGDTNTVANGINDRGIVVGQSFNLKNPNALPHAIVWENGRTIDLNTFLSKRDSLYLLSANDIDDRGNIVGQALVSGQQHAFFARPCRASEDPAYSHGRVTVPVPAAAQPNILSQLLRRFGMVSSRY